MPERDRRIPAPQPARNDAGRHALARGGRTADHATLQALASAFNAGQMTMWEAAAAALQTLIDRVHCSRVSLWRFDLDSGTRALRCFAAKRNGEALLPDHTQLAEGQYRDYFAALVLSGVFVANDASAEPRLAAMRGQFLAEHRVGALLDIAVTINGRAYGIVCCEQIPGPRDWQPEDVAAARAVVSRATLLIAADRSVDLDSMRSVTIEPFDAPWPRFGCTRHNGGQRRAVGKL